METNVNYAIVGAFVIILLSAIILSIIWLSSGLALESYNIYQANMEESISGISTDSPVEFNGVSVGTIKNINVNQKNPKIVELLLKIKKDIPITEATVATLGMRGLTGITFIALQDDGSNITPLQKSGNEEYPIIKTIPSLRMRLDTALNMITKNMDQISHAILALLSKENINLFKALLNTSQRAVYTLQTRTIPQTNQTIENLTTLTQDLTEIAAEIKQNPAVLIRGKEPRPLGPGEHQ